jgi:predicted RNase H-like nuclease
VPSAGGELPYKVVGGIVASAGGWLVASAKLKGATFVPDFPRVVEQLHDAVQRRPAFTVAALNAPIGGATLAVVGQRTCDVGATELIGCPVAIARWGKLAAGLADSENTTNAEPGVALLRARFAEVAQVIAPYLQRSICEAVPDLSFYQLNGERPLVYRADEPDGYRERRELLVRVPGISRILDHQERGVTRLELLEASALLWSARRISARAAKRIPHLPEWDEKGLRVEILR